MAARGSEGDSLTSSRGRSFSRSDSRSSCIVSALPLMPSRISAAAGWYRRNPESCCEAATIACRRWPRSRIRRLASAIAASSPLFNANEDNQTALRSGVSASFGARAITSSWRPAAKSADSRGTSASVDFSASTAWAYSVIARGRSAPLP